MWDMINLACLLSLLFSASSHCLHSSPLFSSHPHFLLPHPPHPPQPCHSALNFSFFFFPPTPFPSGVQKRQVLVGRESEGLCNLWLPMSKGELLLRPRKVNITQVWVEVVVAEEVGGALPEDANFLFSSGGEERGDIWKAGAE